MWQVEEARLKAAEAQRAAERASQVAAEESRRVREAMEQQKRHEEAEAIKLKQRQLEKEAREREERERREREERERREREERERREREERERREREERERREREERERREREERERREREERERREREERERREKEDKERREREEARAILEREREAGRDRDRKVRERKELDKTKSEATLDEKETKTPSTTKDQDRSGAATGTLGSTGSRTLGRSDAELADLGFSKLIVDVVQANGLPLVRNKSPNAFVVLSFQGCTGETEPIRSQAPFWNTNFCFDVLGTRDVLAADPSAMLPYSPEAPPNDRLVVSVWSEAAEDGADHLGQVVIPLGSLRNQFRVVTWLQMQGPGADGRPASGSVQLSLLWLHNIPTLLQSLRDITLSDPTRAEHVLSQINFSKLILDVIEARGLNLAGGNKKFTSRGLLSGTSGVEDSIAVDPEASAVPFVVVDFQNAQVNTDPAKSMRSHISSPVWNINFTFDVSADDGLMARVRVYSHEPLPGAEGEEPFFEPILDDSFLLGELVLNLEDFADQAKHVQWFPLYPPGEAPSSRHAQKRKPVSDNGAILLSLLWLYDLRALM